MQSISENSGITPAECQKITGRPDFAGEWDAVGGPVDGEAVPCLDTSTLENHNPLASKYRDAVLWFDHQSRGYKIPNDPDFRVDEVSNQVVTIQPFRSGGYEARSNAVCLPALARRMGANRKTGKRIEPEERDPETVAASLRRSRKAVRLRVKELAPENLYTFTRRESEDNKGEWWQRGDWARAWKRFCRVCYRAGVDLSYVAVLESHKKGNFHLHVAVRNTGKGKARGELLSRIWAAVCGGKGMGNIDFGGKKTKGKKAAPTVYQSTYERSRKIARYIAKYIAKDLSAADFNKRRYWTNVEGLLPTVKVVMKSRDFAQAIREFCEFKNLDHDRMILESGLYVFDLADRSPGSPSQPCFWFSYDDRWLADCPF